MSSTSRRYRSGPAAVRARPGSRRSRAGRCEPPGLLEAEDARFEFLVRHRCADRVRPGGHGSGRAIVARSVPSGRCPRRSPRSAGLAAGVRAPACRRGRAAKAPVPARRPARPPPPAWDRRGGRRAFPRRPGRGGPRRRPTGGPRSGCLTCLSSLCLVMAASSRQRSPPRLRRVAASRARRRRSSGRPTGRCPRDRSAAPGEARAGSGPARSAARSSGRRSPSAARSSPPRNRSSRTSEVHAARSRPSPSNVAPFDACVERPRARGSPGPAPDALRLALILTNSGPSLAAPAAERALPERERRCRPRFRE